MKDINNKVGYLNDNFKIFHIRDKKDIKFEYHHHDFSKIVILIEKFSLFWYTNTALEIEQ